MGCMPSKVTETEEKGTKAPKGFITRDVALFKLTSQWPILLHVSKHHWNPQRRLADKEEIGFIWHCLRVSETRCLS